LTFANVMSLIAVFIALGGGAYALSRGEVKSRNIARGAVKARQLNLGSWGVPLMATFSNLGTGTGHDNYAPLGNSARGNGQFNETIAPEKFVATGLRVRVYNQVDTGNREFVLRYAPITGPTTTTDLECTVSAGENDCKSSAQARIPEGVDLWFEEIHTGPTNGGYAEVGWRALLP
jgi:hypothetical protein